MLIYTHILINVLHFLVNKMYGYTWLLYIVYKYTSLIRAHRDIVFIRTPGFK